MTEAGSRQSNDNTMEGLSLRIGLLGLFVRVGLFDRVFGLFDRVLGLFAAGFFEFVEPFDSLPKLRFFHSSG